MGLKDLFRKYFVIEDEDDGYEEVDEPSTVVPVRMSERNEEGAPSQRSTQKRSTKAKVIPMNQQTMTEKASIHVVEPRVYSEVEKIADNLLKNQAVLLNFKRIDAEHGSDCHVAFVKVRTQSSEVHDSHVHLLAVESLAIDSESIGSEI